MKIKILNWEKYNRRKDIKSPHWFALSNRFFDDPDFYDFSSEEKLAWIFILTQASLANSDEITVHFDVFFRRSGIQKGVFESTINKLENLAMISTGTRDTNGERTDAFGERALHDMTLHNKNNIAQPSVARQKLNFEEIYKIYPLKKGKERGMKLCASKIKTQDDFDLLKTAVMNYAKECEREGKEKQFIKHFSTFMGCWRDYAVLEGNEHLSLAERYPQFFDQTPEGNQDVDLEPKNNACRI